MEEKCIVLALEEGQKAKESEEVGSGENDAVRRFECKLSKQIKAEYMLCELLLNDQISEGLFCALGQ